MADIRNILERLVMKGDVGLATRLSRHFFGKSAVSYLSGIPEGARVWVVYADSDSDTEQLFVLRKLLCELRPRYGFLPRLELAEKTNVAGAGEVFALPVSPVLVENPSEFERDVLACHPLLRLVKGSPLPKRKNQKK